jgi:hypothetical protein
MPKNQLEQFFVEALGDDGVGLCDFNESIK